MVIYGASMDVCCISRKLRMLPRQVTKNRNRSDQYRTEAMRSQNSILTHTTHSLNALSLTTNQIKSKDQQLQHHYTAEPIQMTTGGSISGNNTNSVATQQKSSTSTLSSCNTIASTSSINTLSKASTISSTARHSNGNLSTHSNNINNNSTTAVNNNNNKTKNNNNNNNSHNNNNNNEGNINPNPNWNKLQTLEQRKLELEKLLNEKNWLLQQIHKQEAQILNGNYENFNLFETGKVGATIVNAGNTTAANTTNSILRRKGSSSLKLSKSNVHFNGKNNRLTLSKSEYDLAQENKLNHQPTTTNQSVMSIKKRQGAPQKTNSFHDSTSASALSLTKSPSFEYNGSTAAQSPIGGNGTHIIKYSVVRPPHQGSTENLSNNIGVTQCDKYYLSPTSQMYSDGSGFIKASQNIKQCLSPSPLHKIIALNDTDSHRAKQQPLHSTNGHKLVHHNGSQPHLEQYESVDALSLSPSTNCAFDQGQHIASQHSNLWRTISNSDRSGWCDSTSYVELDSDGGNPYHNIKPLAKKVLPGSSMQQSPESPSLGNFYPVGGMGGVGSYPNNAVDKASDEISISSVNSETSKKPKNKQWMESSLDGPIIRPNILQSTPSVVDAIALCPALSPTLSQNPQYTYYVAGRQATTSSAAAASGKLTPSPAPAAGGGSLLMPVATSRPPTRTLTHHSHPHHKQSYRERTKLSSQSMSSGSYRAPKTKLDDDNNHLSHSTSFLNVDPYHQHNFHMQPSPQQQQQPYHHNHYHTELTNNGNFTMPHLLLQQQQQQQHAPQMHHQKPLKPTPSSTSQQPTVAKISPTIQQQCTNGDDFVGTIRYATSVATQPSRLCNPSQAITKNTMQKAIPPNSLSINPGPQLSPQTSTIAATSPDIRIESPKNMTVVQQATFLPYKEVTKPFEMSDFYKYSTKFRQKDANTATISKNTS